VIGIIYGAEKEDGKGHEEGENPSRDLSTLAL